MNDRFKLPSGRKPDAAMIHAVSDDAARQSDRELINIPLDQIKPDPNQPRKYFPQDMLDERQAQLEENGQVSPITVYPPVFDDEGRATYLLHDGECRWRAASQSNKIETLRAEIYQGDQSDTYRIRTSQLLHNDEGALNITNFERALAYRELYDLIVNQQPNHPSPIDLLAKDLGKPQSEISRVLSLSKAPETVKHYALEEGVDDLKTINSLIQLDRLGGGQLDKAVSGFKSSEESARKFFAESVRKAKSKSKRGRPITAGKKKKARTLAAKNIQLKVIDGEGVLSIETPRELIVFKLSEEILKQLKEVG